MISIPELFEEIVHLIEVRDELEKIDVENLPPSMKTKYVGSFVDISNRTLDEIDDVIVILKSLLGTYIKLWEDYWVEVGGREFGNVYGYFIPTTVNGTTFNVSVIDNVVWFSVEKWGSPKEFFKIELNQKVYKG